MTTTLRVMSRDQVEAIRAFLAEVKTQDTVPFVPSMSVEKPPTFDDEVVCPLTEDVFYLFVEGLHPMWTGREGLVFGDAMDPFLFLWKDDRDYYGVRLSHDQSREFAELMANR